MVQKRSDKLMDNSRKLAPRALEKTQHYLRIWSKTECASRVDVYCSGLGDMSRALYWLTVDGVRKPVRAGRDSIFAVNGLRGLQALPGLGAWFYSHLWMEMPEGVLHQESDWMCEPDMGFDEVPLGSCKTELDRYPRDQEFIPDWLRYKVERWRLERGPVVARRVAHLEEEFRLEGGKYRYP